MVKGLLALFSVVRSAPVLELVGAGLVVYGIYRSAWGTVGALVGSGVALLLKSFEVDLAAR